MNKVFQNINIPPFTESLDFIAIDTETTGLDSQSDEIIEIAAIRFVKGEKVNVFNSFIKPKKSIPPYIEFLTQIKPIELKNAPPLKMVLKQFRNFVGQSIIIGQNTRFDLDFINVKLIEIGDIPLNNLWWDTSELSRIYLPFIPNHKLETLCDFFGIELPQAHRAIYDAEATGYVLINTINYIIKHFNIQINSRVLELSKQAQLESDLSKLLEFIVDYQRKYSVLGIKVIPIENKQNNIIENKCLYPKIFSLSEIFSENGVLHQNFDCFEFRPAQMKMAEIVQNALQNTQHCLVEAGTGVGKSFAYLIPALQFSFLHNKRIVISTNTKNLQEQLFTKDLPQLKTIINLPFKAVLVKGRENYICERKWEELLQEQSRNITSYDAAALLYLIIWKQLTKTGDISENSSFDRNRFGIAWRRLCSDRYYCAGRKCPYFGICYVMKLRKNLDEANLIIINHSLLIADFKADHTGIGNIEYLIIDEAHNIIPVASKQMGIELSYTDLMFQLNQLSPSAKRKISGPLDYIIRALENKLLQEQTKKHIQFIISSIHDLIDNHKQIVIDFFSHSYNLINEEQNYGKYRIVQKDSGDVFFVLLEKLAFFWSELVKLIHSLSNVFSSLNSNQIAGYDELIERISGIEKRAAYTEELILQVLNPIFDDYVLWLETDPKSNKTTNTTTLYYTPIEVDKPLKNLIYDNVPSIIFTSATLALRGSFKYFMKQSGLSLIDDRSIMQEVIESPFDFQMQSRLMVTGFLPEPSDKFFLPQATNFLVDLIINVPVGTLVLFTSYNDLENVYQALSEPLYQKNRLLFGQGKWSNRVSLLNEFKKANDAVLLGTGSFWEGIDVQGESLSMLILFKLPFQVPSEPVVEAIIEKTSKEGKNAFMYYSLPNALLRLKQGFGRLIRSKTDKGIVLIFDSRIKSMYYGKYFTEILPTPCSIISDPVEMKSKIIDFFRQSHSAYKIK